MQDHAPVACSPAVLCVYESDCGERRTGGHRARLPVGPATILGKENDPAIAHCHDAVAGMCGIEQ